MNLTLKLEKAAAHINLPALTVKLKHLAAAASGQIEQHPVVAVTAAVGSSVVAVLQSAQEIVGTLIALVTSLSGLVVAVIALRAKWKDRNKSSKE